MREEHPTPSGAGTAADANPGSGDDGTRGVAGSVPAGQGRESVRPSGKQLAVSAMLFFATFITTTAAGLAFGDTAGTLAGYRAALGFDGTSATVSPWQSLPAVLEGLSFSAAVMAILLAHELGHYLTALRHRVEASPPYFLPVPPQLFLFGTLGAFIRMALRRVSGGALLRVAAYGPFAGFVVIIPVLVWGLALSEVRPLPPDFKGIQFGTCLLMGGLEWVFFPEVPDGHDIFLHPAAVAGWAGCLITGLNLLPIGQLDGGHVAYTLFGDGVNRWMRWGPLVLVVFGVLLWPGWLLFAALVAFVVRPEHPPMLRDGPVRGGDRWIGYGAALTFVLTFIPRPVLGGWSALLGS